ncbi:MAG: hypothetical protein U0264_04035 [Candidatus Kapaibacterium sp.]
MKLLFTVFLFCTLLSAALAQHPDDYRWDDRFSKPGISNPEYNGAPIRGALALAANSDYVIVGGQFTVPGNNIALWNKHTKSWEKAGNGVWKNPTQYNYPDVNGLIAFGDTVYVFGNFATAGEIEASGFAMFNTRTKVWSTDTLFSGYISTISVVGNEMLVFGGFTIKGAAIRNMARLKNGQWSQFQYDSTMIPGTITEYKGELYSNVRYKNLNNYTAVSKWDGNTWIPVFKNAFPLLNSYQIPVRGIQATNDYLYVYGALDSVELPSGKIIKGGSLLQFDGLTWSTMIDSIIPGGLSTFWANGEDIYIAGEFSSVQGYNANRIAKWDHTTKRWSGLGSGISGDDYGVKINTIHITDNQVYAAGQFATAGSQNVNNIARFDQSTFTWYPLGDAKTNAPCIIGLGPAYVFNDNNKLLVIGNYEYAGDKRINSVGYWTGNAWENAGTGIIGGAGYVYNGAVRFFTSPTGLTNYARIGTTTYLAGTFETVGASSCDNIITYDNGSTECVGGGVTQSHQGSSATIIHPASITSIQSIRKDLYVTGNFTKAGNVKVESIAKWDGSSWNDIGGVFGSTYSSYKLAEDSLHRLLVFGNLTKAGQIVCNGIASWDGHQWEARGYKSANSAVIVNSLCVAPDGTIILSGYTSNVGYPGYYFLGMLQGDSIVQLSNVYLNGNTNGSISAIACKGDMLYIAGNFDHIGTIDANNVAVYNLKTQQWSSLGSGFVKTISRDTVTHNSAIVRTIAFVGDTVYFGGLFSYAGGKPSFNIAAWLPAKPNNVEQISTSASIPSLSIQPNPAYTTVTLTFALPHTERVTISLRDALGREVQRISEGELQAGGYQTHIDCSTLAVGAYYCVMTRLSGVQSQMLIINR